MVVHQVATAVVAVVSLAQWRLLKYADVFRFSRDADGVGFP
jgi:hypothetical protein